MSLLKIALSLAAIALLAADAGSHGVSLAPATLLPGASACLVTGGAAPAGPALAAR